MVITGGVASPVEAGGIVIGVVLEVDVVPLQPDGQPR